MQLKQGNDFAHLPDGTLVGINDIIEKVAYVTVLSGSAKGKAMIVLVSDLQIGTNGDKR